MSSRLIVVSNRIPTGDAPSGGLVVALHGALVDRGGVWIGAAPDCGPATDHFETLATEPYTRLSFTLTQQEYDDYYLGFSNSVLWPLFHRRGDLVQLRAEYWQSYQSVNERLAEMIAKTVHPSDTIWIHDYHFLPLAKALRRHGLTNRIAFFLHIPFPTVGDLAVLPEPDSFADWMAQYDLVGLQTRADTARALEMFRADPRAEFLPDGSIKFEDRRLRVEAFPIGIDVESFAADALGPSPFKQEEPTDFIIGVDRLDYSKGLPNRFNAFGQFLADRDDPTVRPTLLQIAPPTREAVEAYRDITRELEEIAGHINGAYADLDWTPIRYIHRPVDRSRLARLYRRAKACLVTSLADGMNLVAKEFIAAQDPVDPGVLILSRLAGAAEDMDQALLINPYDQTSIAQAIAQALTMPIEERVARHEACLKVVQTTDVRLWAETILTSLTSDPGLPWAIVRPETAANWTADTPTNERLANLETLSLDAFGTA